MAYDLDTMDGYVGRSDEIKHLIERGRIESNFFGQSSGPLRSLRSFRSAGDRVRPDAERQREHRHGGEAGVLQQLAEREAQVTHILPFDRTGLACGIEGPTGEAGCM